MTLPKCDERGRFPVWFCAWRAAGTFAWTLPRKPRRAIRDARTVYQAWRAPVL